MMSGSWRSTLLRPLAKVIPFFSLTCVWLIPGNWYSMGSSSVNTLLSLVLICCTRGVKRCALAAARRAGDQDQPVLQFDQAPEGGHVHRLHAQLAEAVHPALLSSNRSTIRSP